MEAVNTFTPHVCPDLVVDDYLESLSEEERAEFVQSILDAHEEVMQGHYYEMDEVFCELERRIADREQNPLSDERIEELKKKFGDPEEMLKGLADACD